MSNKLKENCEMKLRLLYIELHTIATLINMSKEILLNLPFFLPSAVGYILGKLETDFPHAQQFYKDAQQQLPFMAEISALYHLDNDLENWLGHYYEARCLLTESLLLYLATIKKEMVPTNFAHVSYLANIKFQYHHYANSIENQINKLIDELDMLLVYINTHGDVDVSLRIDFENNLKQLFERNHQLCQVSFEALRKIASPSPESIPLLYTRTIKLFNKAYRPLEPSLKFLAHSPHSLFRQLHLNISEQCIFYFLYKLFSIHSLNALLQNAQVLYDNYQTSKIFYKTQRLKELIGNDLSTALSLQRHIALLEQWKKVLTTKHNAVTRIYKTLFDILSIKELLGEQKLAFFKHFFQEHNTPSIQVLVMLEKNLQLFLKDNNDTYHTSFLIILKNQLKQHRDEISNLEMFLQNYSWPGTCLASTLQFTTHNYYYRAGQYLFLAAEEATHTAAMQHMPLLNVKLTDGYSKVFSHLSGCLLFGLELYGLQTVGVMPLVIQNLLQTLVNNSFTDLIKFMHRWDQHEQFAVKVYPFFQWSIGLFIHVFLQNFILGFNFQTVSYQTGNYAFSTFCQSVMNQLFNKYFTLLDKQPKPSTLFFKSLAHYGTYITSTLSWQKVYSTVNNYFSYADLDNLLLDASLCQKYQETCQRVALQTLDLQAPISKQAIQQRWRTLALKYHPDKQGSNPMPNDQFYKLRNAKLRLFELMKNNETNYPTLQVDDSNKKFNL